MRSVSASSITDALASEYPTFVGTKKEEIVAYRADVFAAVDALNGADERRRLELRR